MYEKFINNEPSKGLTFDYLRTPPEAKTVASIFAKMKKEAIMERILNRQRWRYHHGLDELKQKADTYHAYCSRIEAMMSAISGYFDHFKIPLAGKSAVDLACSEGFFTNYFEAKGITDIDAYELSETGIERFHLIRAYKGLAPKPVGQIDFELPLWSDAVKRKYDVVFCLGILYHMENPMLFLRNVAEITSEYLVLETDTPISQGSFANLGCFHLNVDRVALSSGVSRKLLEFRPDRQALVQVLMHAGFNEVPVLPAAPDVADKYFTSGQKSIVVARR